MNKLGRSIAGHDKGHVYAILREEGGMIYLADGNIRTLDNPKKKNPKHIQEIKKLPDEVREALSSAVRDSDLIHVLRMYRSTEEKESEKR